MGVNKVILLGNLGRDPELRYTQSQTAICTFSIATTERRKDASGTWTDHTEWHNIVTFGKTAENCANFLKKGRQVFIDGKIQTRKWQDKEGKDRYTTEILANNVQFIGSKEKGAGSGSSMVVEQTATSAVPSLQSADTVAAGASIGGGSDEPTFDEDDIPF